MQIVRNFIGGILNVLTASQPSKFLPYRHASLADGLLGDWQGVAKDLKRVQNKLKAEAHDGRKTT